MSSESKLERMVKYSPWSLDDIMSHAINFFIQNLEPERADMVVKDGGFAIRVETDDENVDKALSFWEDHVIPKLKGE